MFSLKEIPARKLALTGALVSSLLLAGCAQTPDMFSSASPNAAMVSNLFFALFVIAVIVFVLVEGLLIYSVIRFRRKSPDEMPEQIHGNTRLEIAWTVIPAIVLFIVFLFTWQTLQALASSPPGPTVKIKVTGTQWWWEVNYPELGVTTANEVHIPAGTAAVFELESRDVIHSFWAPELGGKMDLVPGKVNRMWLRPVVTGSYHGQCAEFCGLGHANMRLTIIVDTEDQFNAWVQGQKLPAPAPSTPAAQQGKEVFEKSACIGCHTITGTAAAGKIGPNLTHVFSRKTIAAGTLELTRDNLRAWIDDPQGHKPGALMPKVPLSADQLNALVSYLETLK